MTRVKSLGHIWFLLCLAAALLGSAYAFDDGLTEYLTIPAGSYIVDMGQASQTVGNGLKPYGLIYSLVKNQRVPLTWVINPSKAKDGTDFSYNAKNYRGGPFIIEGPYITPAVVAVINTWKAQGVVVDGPIGSSIPGVPVYDRISSFPNTVLDAAKGSIAAGFYVAAGIPSTAYGYKSPALLNSCDDFYPMPHADPTWANHSGLLAWVNQGGSVWAGCHAVSVLENLDNPATATNPDTNFLSQNGLVAFGSHGPGSPPYSLGSTGGDPAMQFIGTTDTAHLNGSEQIYLPKPGGAWRPSTKVLVYDPTQVNVPSKSPGLAGVIVYGRAFGNPSAGYVIYEGGHNIGGTAPANVAAQRAFFNVLLLAGISRRVEISTNIPLTVTSGQTVSLSASAAGGSGIYSYQWSSNGGGSFSPSASSANPTFTAPSVTVPTTILVRVLVSDSCGRINFVVAPVLVNPPPQADLAISKSGTSSVAQGGSVGYTLTLTNNGPSIVSGAVLSDNVPAAITGVSWSCAASGASSCGSTSSGSGNPISLTTGSLGIGAANKLTINVTGTASTAGTITNTASVAPPPGITDLVSANNSSSQITTILPPVDLSITKTGPASIFSGVNYSYTLSVKNNSAITGTNIALSDVLPSELSFVSASGSGWTCGYNSSTRNMSCNLASLAAGLTSTITLSVTPTGTIGSTVSNMATVSSLSQPDNVPANNTSTATSTFAQPADLGIAKTGVASTGGGSQTNTFTVTLTNNGPGTANTIVVTDILGGPDLDKVDFTSATASVGTFTPSGTVSNPTGGTWTIPSLASGASATLTLLYTGDNNNGLTNTVTVASATHDPVSTNNRAEVTIMDPGTVITPIDLSIGKTALPASVGYGGTITYSIQITNNSTTTDWSGGSRTISITDTLPAGVSYTTSSGTDWSCVHTAGIVTCQYNKDINRNGAKSTVLSISVSAPSVPGTLLNSVQLQAMRDKTTDPNLANNSATATVTVVAPSADIQVSKSVDNASPNLGSNVSFTITARNNGPNTATGVWIGDALPAGLSYVSSTASQGSYNPSTGEWQVGSLGSGFSATLTLVAKVTLTSSLSNTASLSSLDQNDPTPANNSASANVAAVAADLGLIKTVSNATPNVGDTVVFTIALSNNGPSTASSIGVQDLLPSGAEYVSHTASAGSYDSASGLWSGVSLTNGASATLAITATITTPLALTNTATIVASSVMDPNPANDQASVGVQGQQVDIALSKTVNNNKPTVLGTPLTFSITAKNEGPSQASNVVVKDLLPAGLSYVGDTPSQGSYASGSGLWSVGTLAVGASATLQIIATNTVNGTLLNTASLQASDQPDINSVNNTASVQVLSGGSADLTLTKVVDNPSPALGSQVTFSLVLDSAGPDPATGIVVQDILPPGLAYLSSTASQGSFNPLTGNWTVGTLASGQVVTLDILVETFSLGYQDNHALVIKLDQADPDTTNDDSLASVDVRPLVNLAISKTGPAAVAVGSPISYTLTVTNTGPSDAVAAVIADTVPASITSVSWTCSASGFANCGSASGSGNNISLTGDIPAGIVNSLTIVVSGTATTPGSITNTASVSPPPGTYDPDCTGVVPSCTGNNQSSRTTLINLPPTTADVNAPELFGSAGPTAIPALSGSDPDGSVASYRMVSLPAAASGVLYVCNPTCAALSEGQVIAAADAANLRFDPTGGFNGNASFTYAAIDNHGLEDPTPATYTIPVSGIVVSGMIWNDADANITLSGSETGTDAGGLTVYAVNDSGNVVAKATVAADGSYTFNGLAAGSYTLRLSTDPGVGIGDPAPVVSLPSGWTSTGENINGTVETTTPGEIAFFLDASDLTNLNFGIAQLPGISGRVYADIQPNQVLNSGEDWSSGVRVYVNLVKSGSIVQSVTVNSGNGTYQFTQVVPGSYEIIVTDSDTNTSAVAPTGWLFIAPDKGSLNLVVGVSEVSNQDFGLYHGSKVSGKVFYDDGLSAGTANDALQNGGELGVADVVVTLSDGTNSLTTSTNTHGDYSFYVPYTYGSSITISHDLLPATGTNIADASMVLATAYADAAAQARSLSFSSGQLFNGYNFGLVRPSVFKPDQSGQVTSPGTITYIHLYQPGTLGTVSFAESGGDFSYQIRLDANCDGSFDASEAWQTGPSLTVDSTWPRESDGSFKTCAVEVRVIVPGGLPANTVDIARMDAALSWANNPSVIAPAYLTDTTTVVAGGVLHLNKEVRNITQGGSFAATAQAKPSDILEYRIHYKNLGAQPLFEVELLDPLPFYSDLQQDVYSGSTEVQLHCPDGSSVNVETGSVSNLLLDLSAHCTLSTAPHPSGSGTTEALLPGEGGYFLYRVRVR